MVEEISANLFRIEIPLPESPLKSLNSYIIKDSERNLIIDTGLNRQECMNAMQSGLREIGVDLGKTDFLITHHHADHFGLISSLATEQSKIYFGQIEAVVIESGAKWENMIDFARLNGFPEAELQAALHNHPAFKYGSKRSFTLTKLKENDRISIGDYLFRCIHTPGHTIGHLCLYESNKKILISGDHILIDITPNIQLWSNKENPLNEYLNSLDKVYDFAIDLALPGHRRIISNCKGRIQELKDHHQRRADEVLSILEKGSNTAYGVASQMSWDIACDSWEQFPVSQKWFATGEAISHLKYLEEKGHIRQAMEEDKITFSLSIP